MAPVAAAAVIAVVAATLGLRPDVVAGDPHPVGHDEGMLLLLDLHRLLRLSHPPGRGLSKQHRLALGAGCGIAFSAYEHCTFDDQHRFSNGCAVFRRRPVVLRRQHRRRIAGSSGLTLWLRSGAPTAINRIGWLVGLASGSFGAFVYGLHCSSISVFYVGLWYTGAIMLCALLGRLIVPRLIRW